MTPGKYILGRDLSPCTSGVALADCLSACEAQLQCRSVDFRPGDGACCLGDVSWFDEDFDYNDWTDDSNYEYYSFCPGGE